MTATARLHLPLLFALLAAGSAAGLQAPRSPASSIAPWSPRTASRGGEWTPALLRPLPGDSTARAYAINAGGQVAGFSQGRFGPLQGVVWDRRGTPSARPPTPGALFSLAFAINDRGEVAGQVNTNLLSFRAAVWDRDGTPRLLEDFGADTQATSINDLGEVAGTQLGTFPTLGLRWDRSGSVTALPPLPGDYQSLASAINERGEVAGRSEGSAGQTAVLWDRGGVPRALRPLPGDQESAASDLDDYGRATGESIGPSGRTAVVWERDGTPIALLPPPGSSESYSSGMNAVGEVAGTGDFRVAVVWRRDGTAVVLPPPPGLLGASVALAIGPRGDVVGLVGTDAVLWRRTGAGPRPSSSAGGPRSWWPFPFRRGPSWWPGAATPRRLPRR